LVAGDKLIDNKRVRSIASRDFRVIFNEINAEAASVSDSVSSRWNRSFGRNFHRTKLKTDGDQGAHSHESMETNP
jgi:hypothetical protein